jgi:hypothetical protein
VPIAGSNDATIGELNLITIGRPLEGDKSLLPCIPNGVREHWRDWRLERDYTFQSFDYFGHTLNVDVHNDLQEAHHQRSGELSIVGYTDALVTNARNIHAIFSCCSIKPVRKSLVPIS